MAYRVPIYDAAEFLQFMHTTYRNVPPKVRSAAGMQLNGYAQPIGSYLISLGYISPTNMVSLLMTQRQIHKLGEHVSVGSLLIQQKIIPPSILALTLTLQAVDRLMDPNYSSNLRLGEYLVMQRAIRPAQLANALESQIQLARRNIQVPIGEILVEQKAINDHTLNEHLANFSFATW